MQTMHRPGPLWGSVSINDVKFDKLTSGLLQSILKQNVEPNTQMSASTTAKSDIFDICSLVRFEFPLQNI